MYLSVFLPLLRDTSTLAQQFAAGSAWCGEPVESLPFNGGLYLSIQTGRAITVLFDVLSACAGRGYQAIADGLANTTVPLLQDDLGLRRGGCLFSCIQFRSLFPQRLSVIKTDQRIAGIHSFV